MVEVLLNFSLFGDEGEGIESNLEVGKVGMIFEGVLGLRLLECGSVFF